MYCDDLMFGSRVRLEAERAGLSLTTVSSGTGLSEALETNEGSLILVDLTSMSLELPELVRLVRARSPASQITAFGPHVQQARLETAREAGCDRVLTRGQIDQQVQQLLEEYRTEG